MSNVGVYDRYMRTGVRATLQPSAPALLQNLASCADEIAAEFTQFFWIEKAIPDKYVGGSASQSLKSLLTSILGKREHMTMQQASTNDFDRTVYAAICHHMDEIQKMLTRPPGPPEFLYMVQVEETLLPLLLPWFDFSLHTTRGGRIIVRLRSLLTQELLHSADDALTLLSMSQPIRIGYENGQIAALNNGLEIIRSTILSGGWLTPGVFRSVAPFVDYLKSGGHPEQMPFIACRRPGRKELTKLGLYLSGRIICKSNCKCQLHHQVIELDRTLELRTGATDEAKRERMAILEFFQMYSALEAGDGLVLLPITKARMDLFNRVCKRET